MAMELVEIYHFSHLPEHKLCKVQTKKGSFDCNGCLRSGIGPYFHCTKCKFKLHTHCAQILQTGSLRHPLYPENYIFKFKQRPAGKSCHCCACGQEVSGFGYHCKRYERYMHPCCAALPLVVRAKDGVLLKLHRQDNASCKFCRQNKSGWIYSSGCKTLEFHVACVMQSWLMNRDEHIFVGDGSNSKMSTVSGTLITRGACKKDDKNWIKKYQKYAFIVVRGIIAALFGDPLHLAAAAANLAIAALISS